MNAGKKISAFIFTCILIMPIFLGLAMTASAATAIDIVLHKKQYDTAPSTIQNSGKEMSEFDGDKGLGEIEFRIYDATDEFYQLLAGGAAMEDAVQAVKSADYSTDSPIQTGTTAANGNSEGTPVGDLKFTGLPATVNNQHAVYVIVETPKAGVETAENMVVALPITDPDDVSVTLTTIHLYPKNVVETNHLELEKVSNVTGIGLEGAKFVLHRNGNLDEPQTEYLAYDSHDDYYWTTDKEAAEKFTTNTNGQLLIEGLMNGSYKISEVEAPTGFAMTNEAINKEVTVPGTSLITIQNDELLVEKSNSGGSKEIGAYEKYKVEVLIPSGMNDVLDNGQPRYEKFELTDRHSAQLALTDIDSLELTDGITSFVRELHYLVTIEDDYFVVSFTAAGIAAMTPNQLLEISYQLEVTTAAVPGEEYTNKASIETDYALAEDEGDLVYTGGYNFVKVDASNNDEVLAGAGFVVINADNSYMLLTEGQVSWVQDEHQATIIFSNDQGLIQLVGLADGDYQLKEVQTASDKYVLPTGTFEFTVTQLSYDTTVSLPVQIENKQKGSLPSTGGTGIIGMLVVGGAVMLTAGIIYQRSRRRDA